MASDTSVDRFSKAADFELIVGKNSYSVWEVAPSFIVLDPPTDIPPGEAVLIIRVDHKETRRQIQLPQGADRPSRRTPIIRRERSV